MQGIDRRHEDDIAIAEIDCRQFIAGLRNHALDYIGLVRQLQQAGVTVQGTQRQQRGALRLQFAQTRLLMHHIQALIARFTELAAELLEAGDIVTAGAGQTGVEDGDFHERLGCEAAAAANASEHNTGSGGII